MRALLNDLPQACRTELVELLEAETPVGTWDWDIVRNTFLWSPRQFSHFGLAPGLEGAIEYEAWLTAIHPQDRERVQAAVADAIATGNRLDVTFRVLWREDQHSTLLDVHWLRSRGSVIRDDAGAPLRMVGTSRDVTEFEQRRATERARQDAEAADFFGGPSRFDAYFQSSPDCLVQLKVEPDHRFTYQMINEAGLRVIGMTMAAAHGLTPVDVLGPENGAQMNVVLHQVLETGLPVRYEPTFAYGAKFAIYDATYMPVRDESGAITTILCRAKDVTAERQVIESLRQAQKMDALGQLAAGVSHDFNNLLASLQACFNRLSRIPLPVEATYVLEMGVNAIQQGGALTRRLLAFSRQEELALETVQLNDCVHDALFLLRSSVSSAKVAVNLTSEACSIRADRRLVEACLLNLCINARDARPQDCEIAVETYVFPPGTSPHPDLPAGRYASLTVRDNGSGMSPSVLRSAMDPFFTTKPLGEGTGLGLSMVYGTARSFGGAVGIESVEGVGTQVTMYFPLSPAT